MKFIYVLVALIIIFSGAAYIFESHAPLLYITSPRGAEQWHPGETQTISWVAPGLPLNNKISITIRRIPPPPLQEEGQEFDPIIFTDLQNTGSVSWKISPMYPDGKYVLGISAYQAKPLISPVTSESKQFTITHPKLAADLYPLYSGADWQKSEVQSVTIGSASFSGGVISSAPISAGMNPGQVITPFQKYYDKKLKAAGWSTANDLEAGGHVGGQSGYRKGSAMILTRFSIEYHTTPANAPTECPCDVTLSVFSSEK